LFSAPTINHNQTKHYPNITAVSRSLNPQTRVVTEDRRIITSNMFPQPDAEILARNPQFAILWKDLTTHKINRDGVSKSIALDKETVKVREVLKSKQIEHAKREVVKDAVRAVAFGEGQGGLIGEVSFESVFVYEVR
jgi:hypothetical protein